MIDTSNTNSAITITPEQIIEAIEHLKSIGNETNVDSFKKSMNNLDFYNDYIYILKEAKYYSISHTSFYTIREVTSNIQALSWDISISEKTILDARKDWRIKIFDDFCFWEDKERKYNLFKRENIIKPNMDDIDIHPNILTLLEDITNSNQTDIDYILDWITWKYLNPLSPMNSALVLKWWQGTWKWHLWTLLQTIFSKDYVRLNVSPENFSSHFSAIDEHTLICELSEVGEDNHKSNSKVATKLKTLVMQNDVQVERKYKDIETASNHTSFILSSNKQTPLLLDAKETGNRRYSIFNGDAPYDDKKGSQIYKTITDKKEVAKFIWFLLLDRGEHLKNINVLSAHKNETKDILEQSAGNEYQAFWIELIEMHSWELLPDSEIRKLFIDFCKDRGYKFSNISKLFKECPWKEVRPNDTNGKQLSRHRLIQKIGRVN